MKKYPEDFGNSQFLNFIVNIIMIKVKKRIIIDIKKPSAITITGILYIILYNNHGKARPTVISNTLLPRLDDTALSLKPFLATIIAANISGIDVPAAKNVKPIITDGIPNVAPIISTEFTKKYDNIPIHIKQTRKASIAYSSLFFF